jgi:hypothetical protein
MFELAGRMLPVRPGGFLLPPLPPQASGPAFFSGRWEDSVRGVLKKLLRWAIGRLYYAVKVVWDKDVRKDSESRSSRRHLR